MIANFKREDPNKIIVIGADKAEAILIKNLVEASKQEGKVLSITEYYDVEGNINGFALALDTPVVPDEEPVTPEEPTNDEPENDEENNNEEQNNEVVDNDTTEVVDTETTN